MTLLERDPLSGLCPANRYGIYCELRERSPVYWSTVHSSWVLTRYADVSAVLRHPNALALDGAQFVESLSQRGKLNLASVAQLWSSISFFTRPPRHDAVRRILAQALGGIWRLNLPDLLKQRADRLLSEGEREGSIDLASGYGKLLALFVIGAALGVPEEDLLELSGVAGGMVSAFERILPSLRSLVKLDKSAAPLLDYFSRLIQLRRRSGADDGASLLVRLADQQLGCSDRELAGYCTFFFVAAEETTSAAISGAAHLILQRPALRAQLSGDLSLVPQAAREMLRLVSPVQYVWRQVGEDLRLEGQLIRAGEPLMLVLGAANRDPGVFRNPNDVDLERKGPESLVFAAGPYRCIGAQVAAFEVEVAMRALLAKPRIQLAPQPPVSSERMNIAPLLQLPAYFV